LKEDSKLTGKVVKHPANISNIGGMTDLGCVHVILFARLVFDD
jgi:hypothetical protein